MVRKKSDQKKSQQKATPKTTEKPFGPECKMLYWDDITKDLVGSKDSKGICSHPNKDAAAKGEKGNCATKLSYLHCPNKKSSSSAGTAADKDKKPATQKSTTTTSNTK